MPAKKRTRTVLVFNNHQIRKLVELVAAGYSNSEISTRLNVSESDLILLRNQHKVDSLEVARDLMKGYEKDDKIQEAELVKDRTKAKVDLANAETRLNNQSQARNIEVETKIAKAKKVARQKANAFKDEDKVRQRKLEDLVCQKDPLAEYRKPSQYYIGTNIKRARPIPGKWFLPDNIDPNDFQFNLINKGVNFVKEQFNIKDSDIRREIERLNLKIDFDLLPR